MYDDIFCQIYDALGWNYYPEYFAENLLKWIEKNDVVVTSLLDLGCGTGVLCSIMNKHNIYTHGIDLSPAMIAIAQKRFPDIPFSIGNMVTYRSEQLYSMVTCTCDAMNHLRSLSDIVQMIQNVYQLLHNGGYFIFDLIKDDELLSCPPMDLGIFNQKRVRYEVIHDDTGLVTLKTSLFESNDTDFSNSCEVMIVQEQIYDPYKICSILKDTGFHSIDLRNSLLNENNGSRSTWYLIAQK